MKKEISAQSLNANPLNWSLTRTTVADAASAMDVGLSTMTRWVKQLRDERQGKTPKPPPLPRNKLKSVSSELQRDGK
jgi:transposase-like protein